MFDNVLLTVDLNHKASWDKALPQAVEVLKKDKGVLHVISIVPDFGTPMVSGFFPEDFEEKALEKAKSALADLIKTEVPVGINVETHVAFGKIHKKVLKAITDTGCDLVVMGSQKPDVVREFLVGSNADRIVRRSPVSVLVVRA